MERYKERKQRLLNATERLKEVLQENESEIVICMMKKNQEKYIMK